MKTVQEERGATSQDENYISPYINNFQLPPARESSRFSTTYSFYEFIDQELKEEEERDMLILRVRENIIGSLVEELYNRYMDRQVIPFTVRCFLQSLKKVMNWYFFPRDPEDTALDWERDEPLQPVPVDNWASYCVPAGSYPPKIKFNFKSPFEEQEEEEGEEEELAYVDRPDFKELDDAPPDDFVDPYTWEESVGSLRSSASLSDLSKDGLFSPSASSRSVHKVISSTATKESKSSKSRRAHFMDGGPSLPKIKREINQWISPKNFPPVRVSAGLNILPGEKFSGKTCGRKHTANRNILIRPAKPTFINGRSQELRTFSF